MTPTRRIVVGCLISLLALVVPSTGGRADEHTEPDVARLAPGQGGRVLFGTGSYEGELQIVPHQEGLGLVERQTVNGYLAGIREVPFSWPAETLEAQAIAARTYLAWTLQRGRSEAGAAYGFDICASTRCQVYRGAGVTDGPTGGRWLDALAATSDDILVFDDGPAQALYSASHGSTSRGVEEIWGGSGLPYLVRVESPEEGVSPYESWVFEMPAEIFAQVLRAGGVSIGFDIGDVSVVAEPGSRAVMRIEAASGITTIPVTTVRAAFNVHGPTLYPGLFPGDRPDGRRLPQSVPSYTFTTSFTPAPDPVGAQEHLPPDELPQHGVVVFRGEGWGHGVGMSQWGAFAMGEAGADADEILAHYYGGLEAEPAGPLLPQEVSIGLAWDQPYIEFEIAGHVELELGEQAPVVLAEGVWLARVLDGDVAVFPVPRQRGGGGMVR